MKSKINERREEKRGEEKRGKERSREEMRRAKEKMKFTTMFNSFYFGTNSHQFH